MRLLLLALVLLPRHLAHQQIWKHHENFILAWRPTSSLSTTPPRLLQPLREKCTFSFSGTNLRSSTEAKDKSLSLLRGVTHSRLMVSRFAIDSRDLARNYNHANLIKKSPKANPIGIHCQGWFQEAPRKCGTNRGLRVTSPRKSRSLVRFMADTQQLVKGGQLGNHTRKIGFWAVYCRNTQCATWSDVGDGREA